MNKRDSEEVWAIILSAAVAALSSLAEKLFRAHGSGGED